MDDMTPTPGLPNPTPTGSSNQPPPPLPERPPLSKLAVTSLVLGLIPCTGIAGLICGVIALVRIQRRPGQLRGQGLAIAGTAVSGLTGVLLLPCLAGMLLPAFAKAKAKAQQIQCSNNLRMIGLACRIYNTDNDGKFPANLQGFGAGLGSPSLLICPADRHHTVAGSWSSVSAANISYSYFARGLTNEDPNLVLALCTNHPGGASVVLLGDGSIQMFTAARWRAASETRNGQLFLR